MNILKTIKKGDSYTLGLQLDDAYNMSNMQSCWVYIGGSLRTNTIVGRTIRVELKSSDTASIIGKNEIRFIIDDAVFGHREKTIGILEVLPSIANVQDASIDTGYSNLVVLKVTETTIITDCILADVLIVTVTADSIDNAITEGYSEEDPILEADLIVGQGKKKWSLQTIITKLNTLFVSKEAGNGLSANDLTNTLKSYYDSAYSWVSNANENIKLALDITSEGSSQKFLNEKGEFTAISIGGSASAPLYYTQVASDIVEAYKQLQYTPQSSETEITHSLTTSEQLLASFIYDSPIAIDTIDAGTWYSSVIGRVSSASGVTTIRLEFFMRSSAGVETELFSRTSDEINNTDYAEIKGNAVNGSFTVDPTSYLGVKIYGITTVANKTIYLKTGGQNLSYLQIPLKMRHKNLRGLNEDPDYQHLTTSQLNYSQQEQCKVNLSAIDADIDPTKIIQDPILSPFDLYKANMRTTVSTAPTDLDIIVDIKKNGTSILGNKIKILAGQTVDDGSFTLLNSPTSFEKGDVRTFQIIQVGMGETGKNLIYSEIQNKK